MSTARKRGYANDSCTITSIVEKRNWYFRIHTPRRLANRRGSVMGLQPCLNNQRQVAARERVLAIGHENFRPHWFARRNLSRIFDDAYDFHPFIDCRLI